jgi:hypothetical protein
MLGLAAACTGRRIRRRDGRGGERVEADDPLLLGIDEHIRPCRPGARRLPSVIEQPPRRCDALIVRR